MITIPIWVFVLLSLLAICFVVFFSLFVYILARSKMNDEKEWEKIFDETYKKNNWENGDK
jgi:preprotein translocase subunit YajC